MIWYCSPNIFRVIKWRMRCAEHVVCKGEWRGVFRFWWGKPEWKRPLGRPSYGWDDNIKMDLQEVWRWGMDWIKLAQDKDRWRALVNAVMNLRVPQNVRNFLIGWERPNNCAPHWENGITRWPYRVIQEKSAILWEMIVCVILRKKVHMNMGPILNGYGDMVKRKYGPSCEHEQQLRNK